MERTAITPPKPCFGLEQHEGNTVCFGCKYRKECAELMGGLTDRISLRKVRYRFIPLGFMMPADRSDLGDPDKNNIEDLYDFCHKWVFGKKPKGGLGKYQHAILERADEAGVSLKMFFLANMAGWKYSNHGTEFFPSRLAHDHALEEVSIMSKACQERYGAFDILALDRLIAAKFTKEIGTCDLMKKDFENLILNSEIQAGSWIVNYKLFHAGTMLQSFYKENEISLNPHWLAIEPTYYDRILRPYLDNREKDEATLSRVVLNHRYHAIRLLGRLKKNTRRAITLFTIRERIMARAVERVLLQHGLSPDDLEIDDLPVVEPMRFWVCVGLAILQLELIKCANGEPSVLERV